MKLLRDEMVRSGPERPLVLFEQGIRSEMTRNRYMRSLKYVVCVVLEDILEGSFEERVTQLVKYGREDPDWMLDLMLNMSRKLRDRTQLDRAHPDYFNPASFGNYFAPLKKLLDMNDVALPWKRVYSTYPELDNMPETAGWTRKDIAKMLVHARDAQNRALILVLASSGVRVGALNQLNWGDLTPVYRVDDRLTLNPDKGSEVACAALEVYRGSVENYTAFITPEALEVLQEYRRVWSKMMGKQAGPEDPLFLVTRVAAKRVSLISIRKRVERAVVQSGLRGGSKSGRMHAVPIMNGFRRFYNKTCKESLPHDSTLGSLIKKEYMMGHRGLTPLDRNYFKTNILELAAEYVNAVPDLTIDDTCRLRLENKFMADKLRKIEREKDDEIARMKREMDLMKREVDDEEARLKRESSRAAERRGAETERKKRENGGMEGRMKRDNSEKVSRMREEMADLKGRQKLPAPDVPAIRRESPEEISISGDFRELLIGMMHQLEANQKATLKISAEHKAETKKLQRAMGRMAKEGNFKHDPLAEFREDTAAGYGTRDPNPRD